MIIVEGCKVGIKKYAALMTRRIKWGQKEVEKKDEAKAEPEESEEEKEKEEEVVQKNQGC